MPLIPKKAKAMQDAEMPAGKPSMAMAYDMARRNKKKKKMMAEGGAVNETAKSEHRPMPSEKDKDAKDVSQNSHMKAPKQDSMTSRPDLVSIKGRTIPLKHPKMVPSDRMLTRLRDEEDHLMSSAPTGTMGEQPPKVDDELDAKKSGIPPHKMKMMAKGGMINEVVSLHDSDEDMDVHPPGLESDDDMMGPSEDEYMANHFAFGGEPETQAMESRPDKGFGAIIVPGTGGGGKKLMFAEGGEPSFKDSMEDAYSLHGGMDMSTDEEKAEEHASSIAAAIMSKRKMMAEGGQVDIDENAEEQPDALDSLNEDALLKENYDEDMDGISQPMDSNEHGDSREEDEENDHDKSLVSRIMRKRKSSPITK